MGLLLQITHVSISLELLEVCLVVNLKVHRSWAVHLVIFLEKNMWLGKAMEHYSRSTDSVM